jgi:phospholipase C
LDRDEHIATIARAKRKPLPSGFKALNGAELAALRDNPAKLGETLWQEPGTRPSCALPYELYADGEFAPSEQSVFRLRLEASTRLFGGNAAGGPFNVYLYGVDAGCQVHAVGGVSDTMAAATYVVRPGDTLVEGIALSRFTSSRYDIAVHGPNGFYRHFLGSKQARSIRVACGYERDASRPSAFRIALTVQNLSESSKEVVVQGRSYDKDRRLVKLSAGERKTIFLDIARHHHWYDFSVSSGKDDFQWRYAGRVETGKAGVTDPAMAGAA